MARENSSFTVWQCFCLTTSHRAIRPWYQLDHILLLYQLDYYPAPNHHHERQRGVNREDHRSITHQYDVDAWQLCAASPWGVSLLSTHQCLYNKTGASRCVVYRFSRNCGYRTVMKSGVGWAWQQSGSHTCSGYRTVMNERTKPIHHWIVGWGRS